MAGATCGELMGAFLEFLRASEKGARMTIQRNSSSFTLQVTGAVKSGTGNDLAPEEIEEFLFHDK